MSLDCYPLGNKQTLDLTDQPVAVDVVYNDDLFIAITNQCQYVAIYDLSLDDAESHNIVKSFSLGKDTVIDQIIYSQTGDYLACVAHRNGNLSVYTVFNWRQTNDDESLLILDLSVDQDKRSKLNSIDCCQKTGNIAISCGDIVLIYKYVGDSNEATSSEIDDAGSCHSKADTIIENNMGELKDDVSTIEHYFKHIISVKLNIFAHKICLLENYLSVTAADHVQVLKLELLTLQIQSDGLDAELQATQITDDSGAQSETASTITTCASSSLISNSNSTTTNFSSFNNNSPEQLDNSDISIITMNNQQQQCDYESELNGDLNNSSDDCITWNLKTRKLVKLPSLMHNTSKNLSSYHICHPLELLGPASESIACRVSASIYSLDYSQNQLEAVVMLCKQFDFDKDPVKSTHLQAVYLSDYEDLKRLNKPTADHNECDQASGSGRETSLLKSTEYELLASVTCLVSTLTSCFVYSLLGKKVVRIQTITNPDLCLDSRPDLLNVYLLTPLGLQVCSSGICDSTFHYDKSSSSFDTNLSSSDLNLSFIATNQTRVLTTSNFVITVASSIDDHCLLEYMRKPSLVSLSNRILHFVKRCNCSSIRSNLLTYLHATVQLALLASKGNFTSAQDETLLILKTVTILLCKQLLQRKLDNPLTNSRIDKAIKHLLDISSCDLSELMRRHFEQEAKEKEIVRLVGDSSDDEEQDGWQSTSCSTIILGDDDKPLDTDYELIKIYLKHAKYSQSLLDYLISNSSNEKLFSKLIGYMFEHNPRLLIKCAQRYPLADSSTTNDDSKKEGRPFLQQASSDRKKAFCVQLLVDRLKQLVEFDSTGINRATVLFTLAILYNALEEKHKCLASLGQIKPLNHLAITMCSNYELSHSIGSLVNEHYPDVFNLFLTQLAKRDSLAAKQFSLIQCANVIKLSNADEDEATCEPSSFEQKSSALEQQVVATTRDGDWSEDGEDGVDQGYEEEELAERKLKLVAELPFVELLELLQPE